MLIIVRHGQSVWNLENRFTGWQDVDLTEKGKQEAADAGTAMKEEHIDLAFTSELKRAQHTLEIILKICDKENIPVVKDKSLNERSYGDLEGLNKGDTALKYGNEKVIIWRRSFDVAPPGGESLKDTAERVVPYYQQHIAPKLAEGKNVLIVAHGNSLRALMMYLEKLSPEEIMTTSLPTGSPKKYVMNRKLEILSMGFIVI